MIKERTQFEFQAADRKKRARIDLVPLNQSRGRWQHPERNVQTEMDPSRAVMASGRSGKSRHGIGFMLKP